MSYLVPYVSCAVLGGLLALGCSGPDSANPGAPPVDEVAAGPVAELIVPAPGQDAPWGSMPFPSDLYLDESGHLALGTLPVGRDADAEAVAALQETLSRLDGAGVSTNLTFPVLGEVDPGSLAGQVVLLELSDPATRLDVDAVWRGDLGAIVAVPRVTLRPGRRYGAYVTREVRDPAGQGLRPAAELTRVLAGDTDGVAAARLGENLAPVLSNLSPEERAGVAAATVFRTQDPGPRALAMRRAVRAQVPRVVAIDRFFGPGDAELDAALGDAAPGQAPGIHWEAASAVPHEHIAALMHGRLLMPSFLSEEPGRAGLIDAEPRVKGRHEIEFTLTLPPGPLANTPVVVFVHGINSTRSRAFIVANRLAEAGLATLAIDLPHHGSRGASAVDAENNFTFAPGPDGFGDDVGIAATIDFFHLVATDGLAANHIGAIADQFRQVQAELIALAAFVQDGDVSLIARAAADNGLPADLGFAREVGLFTYSLGGFFGGAAMAVEAAFDTVVMAVPPSGFPYPALFHSHFFGPQYNDILLSTYGLSGRVELGDATLSPRFDPLIDLLGQVTEGGESLGFATEVAEGTYRGGDAPSLLVMEAFSDEVVPNTSTEQLAAAFGVTLVTRPGQSPEGLVRFASLTSTEAPLAANFAAGEETGGMTVWTGAGHGLCLAIEDVQFHEPGLPPYQQLPEVKVFDNPVAASQQQAASFLQGGLTSRLPPAVNL